MEIVYCLAARGRGIVIDEFIDLTKAFSDGPEPKFVNKLLDAISKKAA